MCLNGIQQKNCFSKFDRLSRHLPERKPNLLLLIHFFFVKSSKLTNTKNVSSHKINTKQEEYIGLVGADSANPNVHC